MSSPKYTVGVRTLCEFTARRGDLDLRFTPSPSAQEGISGHAVVAARRGPGYRSEVPLAGEYRELVVRGRADGYDPATNLLEEVKTHRGDVDAVPERHRRVHLAQAQTYGWLLCREFGLAELRIAVIYFDIGSQVETSIVDTFAASELQHLFEERCASFLAHARGELAHAAERNAALAALRFPHAGFRAGQRDLAEGVYRAARADRCLVAQAPTGIGKTIGTLFPLLKAWQGATLDKIFFLTAKGSGRRLAFDAVERLQPRSGRLALRVVELVAREKACEHRDKACHGDSCPLARGFYDRLPAARAEALNLEKGALDQAALRTLALAHDVCPYYLGQELTRWADVVVADYNHWFDPSAMLFAMALAHEWKVALLIDEAHNLLDRARAMYSAELDRANLRRLRHGSPTPLARAIDRLGRRWSELHASQDKSAHVVLNIPSRFAAALQQAVAASTQHLADHPTRIDPPLLELHFELLRFARLFETFGDHSIFEVTRHADGRGSTLAIRNIVPAPHLRRRFVTARSAVLFSATLTPFAFHRDTLGLPADSAWLDVDSPFDPRQLSIRIARHLSTRQRDREVSLAPLADLMARQFEAAPGNYLAFFSSFEYLERAAACMAERHPDVPTWKQSRGMGTTDRDAFLARFGEDSRGIGFAVLGGTFGEGIDLPGRRLIGAFVATLGLPPPDRLNEHLRQRMQASFGDGYGYAYLFPGIQKVVQAVGRVIRNPTDRGVVHLVDDRFGRADVRRLFPRWWRVEPGPFGAASAEPTGDPAVPRE